MSDGPKPNPEKPTVLRIDVQPGDDDYVERFMDLVGSLAGLVRECMTTETKMLLSPYFREMVATRAAEVEQYRRHLPHRLHADNPGPKPLAEM